VSTGELSIDEVMKRLPHRYPFLMVDRIIELEFGKRAIGLKNVSVNEPQFLGHYPGRPIMPGVLLIEAMAQVGGIAVMDADKRDESVPLLAGIDNARFRHIVLPGDQVRIEVEVLRVKRSTGKVHGRALVSGQVAAEADLLFLIGSPDQV